MKKVSLVIVGMALLGIVSCKEQNQEPDTVVVEKEVQAPAASEEESDGTSLSISSDGVEFSTKDGEKSTEVNIDTDEKK